MWACIFRVKWYTLGMHNVLTRSGLETNSSWDVSRGKEKVPLLQWICWVQKSGPIVFFHVCYHVGGSTKHLRRLKVKRRDEESSPSDALTPKKRKTRLAGKMRTYLWARPLTANSQPHLPFPCFCKIKVRGSSKMVWIDAVRTTRYSLILMLCCDVFMFLVKQGVPSDGDLEWRYSSCLLYEKECFRAFRSRARLSTTPSPCPANYCFRVQTLVRSKMNPNFLCLPFYEIPHYYWPV